MPDEATPITGPRPEDVRRMLRVGCGAFLLIVLFGIGSAMIQPYTDWLWYSQDLGKVQVFQTSYGARGTLFLASFLAIWAFLWFNLRRALGASLVYVERPSGLSSMFAANAMAWLTRKGPDIVRWASFLIALLFAIGFSGEWQTFLAMRHGVAFGKTDPMFGQDLGFFVFRLPWLGALASLTGSVLLVTALLTVGIYVGMQALATVAKIELGRPQIRTHISILAGLCLLAWSYRVWLAAFDIGYIDNGQFTGAGFAQSSLAFSLRALAGLLAVSALATWAGARAGEPFRYLKWSLGAAFVWALGAAVIYPTILQRFVVDPNRLAREAPFAERAIAMTRYAYGLDKIRVHELEMQPAPTKTEVAAATPTLGNMRLWDPDVLRQTLAGLQSLRAYYTFNDVDIDRYMIDGKPTLMMLSPRDVDRDGLPANARNWTNLRLRYTHGYGIAMSRVDAATPNGEPVFLAEDVPVKTSQGIQLDRPQIYYSDYRNAFGQVDDDYVLVGTDEKELDYETGSTTVTHEWQGKRGINVGSFFPRLAFSLRMGDGNLLVSSNVGPETRLLMRRHVIERARLAYPFLRFDSDPYMVLWQGKLIWIIDGYTATDRIPYSARAGNVNYIRNSVKVVIDAYDGVVDAYAVMPDEPLLKTYMAAYPGLIRPASDVPEGLNRHFRYAEDMFALQTAVWSQYHVDDPRRFLSNSDAWNIALERSPDGVTRPITPYYVLMKLPVENRDGFFLIRPFTPNGKPNMSGWLAGHCDPATYGQLTLYRFKGDLPAGPELMESKFNSNQEIANINRQFNNDQSEIVVGNSLVIPIGESVMYAESLFLRSRTTGIQATPRLTKVILALNDRIVVKDTYQEALRELFGSNREPSPEVPDAPEDGLDAQAIAIEAGKRLDAADAALRAGDFARYGELQRQARDLLRRIETAVPNSNR